MANLVGDDRNRAVDDLVDAFDAVSEGQGSRMIVLRAPSGEGKTRIIQDFYERISLRQESPEYWPPTIVDNVSGDWKSDRKRLAVAEVRPKAGASIPWLYWSVSCHRRPDNTLAQALFDDLTQFEAHAEALFDKLQLGDVAGQAVDNVNALVSLLGLVGTVAVGGPAGAALWVAGTAGTAVRNKELLSRMKEWYARRQKVASGDLVIDAENHGRQDDIEELADNLTKVSRGVPIVLAVDDAHCADPTLVKFLELVFQRRTARMRRNVPKVLVVVTTWPDVTGGPGERSPFSRWTDDLSAEVATTVTLEPLDDGALRSRE
jgi:hypothetical protein